MSLGGVCWDFFLLLPLRIGVFINAQITAPLNWEVSKILIMYHVSLLHIKKKLLYLLLKLSFFLRQELQIPLLPFTPKRTLLPKQHHLIQNKQQDI